jgi:hypothetical protein
VDELADSASPAGDPDGLRRRLADDGYLFFRGLLPASEARVAGQAVLARLRSGGWVDDQGIPSIRPRDYGVSSVQDMLTSWIPLMGIPGPRGWSPCIRAGSTGSRPRRRCIKPRSGSSSRCGRARCRG